MNLQPSGCCKFAMPALLSSPSRLASLSSAVSVAAHPLFRVILSTSHSVSVSRLSAARSSSLLLKRYLLQGSVRLRKHIMPMMRRGLEASVAGVALVLIFANFFSPGWTNLVRVDTTYIPRAAASRVYSMTTSDSVPSIVVYVTVPNKETGTKLAQSIIENKLAACVNLIPGVESTYFWQGKVETDAEILLIIKTRQALLGELTNHVNANHPYDTPEVVALPIIGGSDKYLRWIEENTKKSEPA